MYKLVALDIDGTLLNKDRAISARTQKAIKALPKSVKVILISSRMPKAMRYLQKELDILEMPLIAYNGGLIIANNKVISSTGIGFDTFKRLLELNLDLDLHLSLYHNDEWYAPQVDYWTQREQHNTQSIAELKSNSVVLEHWKTENKAPHKIMCMGEENQVNTFYRLLQDNLNDVIHLYRSKGTYIEISPKSTDKHRGLKQLLNTMYPSITLEEVVAFGDNYNDIDMIKHVGLGVAMGNAKPELKNIADVVTESNINDGVAIQLEQLFDLR